MHGNFDAMRSRFRNVEPCWSNRMGRADNTHTRRLKHTTVTIPRVRVPTAFLVPSKQLPKMSPSEPTTSLSLWQLLSHCACGCWPKRGQSITIASAFHYSPSFSGRWLYPGKGCTSLITPASLCFRFTLPCRCQNLQRHCERLRSEAKPGIYRA